jgi:radical SAM superfamily enzyme YgiQ (UPF0313 family)
VLLRFLSRKKPATDSPAVPIRKVHLWLIKPSQYDDDGYVVRHWRGVLPSNTLACLAGLTEELIAQKRLGESVKVNIHVLDETVDKIPLRRICRSQRNPRVKTIVCLAGVQTNQFPRAADLAFEFRRAGLTVLIGGFHVSGYLALLPAIPPDIQSLLDAGVTIVKGEVEETWGDLLLAAIHGRLQPLYDFLNAKPDLYTKPIPVVRKKYLRKFVAPNFGTLDCGRGCPFDCSFCTIINVQGRKMRFRSAEHIAAAVRHNFRAHKVSFYFFTDDNFARNKNWEAIFDALIHIREQENIPVEFMMQVDVLSWKIRNFVEKARRAGCINVFIGMESVNPANLAAAGKTQNRVEEFSSLIEAYRSSNISSHVGYIIGFPHDTADSVRRDVQFLMREVRPDHASFFMLMPLPGSMDHLHMSRAGDWMDPDFNRYDSHHEVMHHPLMKDGEWRRAYFEAWNTFYSFDYMKELLQRGPRANYWNNFLRFLWYKNSIQNEQRHPMMCGFIRLKGRKNLRPGLPVLSRWNYFRLRTKEIREHLRGMLRVLAEMEELWLQTRHPSAAEQRVVEELSKIRAAYGRMRLADWQSAYKRAKTHFPSLRVPSKLQLFRARCSPLLAPASVFTRADLAAFWQTVRERCTARRWFRIPVFRLPFQLLRDAQLLLLFLFHMARAR